MDSYRRGKDVNRYERARNPKVDAPYRPLVLLVWVIGVVLLLVTSPLGPQAGLGVLVVTHICFAGFVRADISTLRRQGLDWGFSRHLWFAGALVLPFVAPVYYLYCGRRVAAENRARGYDENGDGDGDGEAETEIETQTETEIESGVDADATSDVDADTTSDTDTTADVRSSVDAE